MAMIKDPSTFSAAPQAMPLTLHFSDYDLPGFMRAAANFGTDRYAFVVTPNTDHLIRYCDEPSFRELYRQAEFVLLDSRFLANLLRVTLGVSLPVCPGSDVTAELFNEVMRPDDRIVVIGGSENQAAMLAERHGLKDIRHYNPPMGFIKDPAAVEKCLQFIEAASPFRFCLLAVGSPQQESLARALAVRGRARGLALCVGASINFLTGGERRAPRWLQSIGMEWLYRLASDPTRMAKRYLVRGPRIFLLLPRLKFMLRSPGVNPVHGHGHGASHNHSPSHSHGAGPAHGQTAAPSPVAMGNRS